MSKEYSGACTDGGKGRFADSDLIIFSNAYDRASRNVCLRYSDEIERMKRISASFVATVGGYGHLTRTAGTAPKRVSNRDYRAAVTHEAVCYLGFLGECPNPQDRSLPGHPDGQLPLPISTECVVWSAAWPLPPASGWTNRSSAKCVRPERGDMTLVRAVTRGQALDLVHRHGHHRVDEPDRRFDARSDCRQFGDCEASGVSVRAIVEGSEERQEIVYVT